MKKEVYINRYGLKHTFTFTKEGNVLWEGDFQYCRYGCPNDYKKTYKKYLKDQGKAPYPDHVYSLEQFKVAIHEPSAQEGDFKTFQEKYQPLVRSNTEVVNMVDPMGGPYLAEGMSIKGNTIVEFRKIEEGYLIVCKKTNLK